MNRSYLTGNIEISGTSIQLVSTDLNLSDFLGAVMVRWGINRNNFRVKPGLYGVGNPDPYSVSVSDLSLINTSAAAVPRVNSDNIHVFPTVISNNTLIIETKGLENSKLSITNLNGQSLYNCNLNSGRTTFNTSFLKSGMYMVQVTNGTESTIAKIIIQ